MWDGEHRSADTGISNQTILVHRNASSTVPISPLPTCRVEELVRLPHQQDGLLGAAGADAVQLGVHVPGEVGGRCAEVGDQVGAGHLGEGSGHAVQGAAADQAEQRQEEGDARQDAESPLTARLQTQIS